MTQLGADTTVIELGLLDADDDDRDGPRLPTDARRRWVIALLTLVCLLTLAASVRGRPSLGEPLWTGSVSLNGFTVGTQSLYQWRLDGKAAVALDLFTGRPRWSLDVTGKPGSIVDLGSGVTVVTTNTPFVEGARGPVSTVTLVRDANGERIAEISGDGYVPTVDGRMLVVFSRRFDHPVDCGADEASASCLDVTAWDVGTGAVAWKVSLPPNADYLPYLVDGRIEALAELDADGAVRLRDLSTGAVTGGMTLSPEVSRSPGEIALASDLVLTAQRGPEGITVTAYQQPSLDRRWSAVVPDHTAMDDLGDGMLYLSECGPAVCMTVHGVATWPINPATGSVGKPITFEFVGLLGGGVFVASPVRAEPRTNRSVRPTTAFIVDPDGRTVARLMVADVVDWSNSGDRVLTTDEGPARTDFRVVDDRGTARTLGSVPGTGLTCHAHADIVACSDSTGTLRVWRIPV
jgi:hypothetical protein